MEVTSDGFLILSKLDVFLYAVPSKRAEKAKYWDLSQPLWSGNLILLANDGNCIVRLEDEGGVIFDQTGVESYPGDNLKPVEDSRRYFSLRFSNQVYGIGFVSGEESGKFISAIEDHCLKYQNLSYVPEPGEIEVLQDDRISLGGKSYVAPGFTSFDEMFFAPLHNYQEKCRTGNRLLSKLDRDQGLSREKIKVGQMFDFDSRTLRQVQEANTCPVCKTLFKTPEGLQQHSIQKHGWKESETDYSWLNLNLETALTAVSLHESAPVAFCPVNNSGTKRGIQGHSRRQRKKRNPSVLRGVGSGPHRAGIKDQYTSTTFSGQIGSRRRKMKKKGSNTFQPMHFVYSHDLRCVHINKKKE
jgi:hypothetical protein